MGWSLRDAKSKPTPKLETNPHATACRSVTLEEIDDLSLHVKSEPGSEATEVKHHMLSIRLHPEISGQDARRREDPDLPRKLTPGSS